MNGTIFRGPRVRGLSAGLGLLMFVPLAVAQEYKANVHPTLHGIDVSIETVEHTGMLVLKLTNRADAKVRCDLRYDASPQVPYRTRVNIEPGKTEQSVFRAKRTWFTVDVDVECQLAAAKSP